MGHARLAERRLGELDGGLVTAAVEDAREVLLVGRRVHDDRAAVGVGRRDRRRDLRAGLGGDDAVLRARDESSVAMP